MSNKRHPNKRPDRPIIYEIRIEGRLQRRWAEWFGSVTMTDDGGDTLLTFTAVDQAALYGLLRKVRDLGLPLLSVTRVEPGRGTLDP